MLVLFLPLSRNDLPPNLLMTLKTGFLFLALLASVPAHAAVVITASSAGNSSQMPGSPTDFTLFGNPTQFSLTNHYQDGVATQPTILNDFQAYAGADAQYSYGAQNDAGATNYNPAYGSITTPGDIDGTQKTGILYSRSADAPDLVDFTLGGGSTFNYADFTVYVMISNAPASGLDDAQLFASLYDPTGAVALATASPLVIDATTTVGTATYEEFHITGASAGDILSLGALSANGNAAYLSGVSFQSNAAPEPSTWAMLGLGLGVLAFFQRRRLALAL